MEDIKVEKGRPRLSVDFAPILHRLQPRSMGWRRLSTLYFEKTGQLVSRETLKRRFEEKYPLTKRESREYKNLNTRSLHGEDIFKLRIEGKTLREIGEMFNITRERVRQILKEVKIGTNGKGNKCQRVIVKS